MSLQDELTAAFVEGYRIAGKEVGYWGRRFLQAVKNKGGLATAKRNVATEERRSAKRA